MKPIDTFYSISLFLHEQLQCRCTYNIPAQDFQEDIIQAPQKESLKNITKRVKEYIEQYENFPTVYKQQVLREINVVRIHFKKVLNRDKNSHHGIFKKINQAIYCSALKLSVEKCIKNTFSDLPNVNLSIEFKTKVEVLPTEPTDQDALDGDVKKLTHSIADYLNKSVEKFHLMYNPFTYDVFEAIECALHDQNAHFASYLKEFLLNLIEEKYSSIIENFTEEQVRDVETDLRAIRRHTLLREHYESLYSEYDMPSLQQAVEVFRKAHAHDDDSVKPICYPVIRHRMPGQKANQSDYETLRQRIIALLDDPEMIAYMEKILSNSTVTT